MSATITPESPATLACLQFSMDDLWALGRLARIVHEIPIDRENIRGIFLRSARSDGWGRAAATGAERESLLAEAARAESAHGATPETDRARRALGGEAPRHTVATPHATCDRCGEEISDVEAEAGWPVASDDGHICPGCYGPEAYCSTCGDVLPAHEEGSRCPSCAKARGEV